MNAWCNAIVTLFQLAESPEVPLRGFKLRLCTESHVLQLAGSLLVVLLDNVFHLARFLGIPVLVKEPCG